MDPVRMKENYNVGGVFKMVISTLKGGTKTLTGQKQTPEEDTNSTNYIEVSLEEVYALSGVHSGEYSEYNS